MENPSRATGSILAFVYTGSFLLSMPVLRSALLIRVCFVPSEELLTLSWPSKASQRHLKCACLNSFTSLRGEFSFSTWLLYALGLWWFYSAVLESDLLNRAKLRDSAISKSADGNENLSRWFTKKAQIIKTLAQCFSHFHNDQRNTKSSARVYWSVKLIRKPW